LIRLGKKVFDMIRAIIAAAFAAGLSISTATAATVTVLFDNFNSYAQGTPRVNPGLAPWTITAGSIDVIGAPTYASWCGVGQGNCLDMNGSSKTAGRIERVVGGLIVGQTYELTFDFGNNRNSQKPNVAEVLAFGFGATSYALNIFAQTGMTASQVYRFVATNTSQTLFFRDAGNTPTDNGGPLLDNVRLSTVPLPAGLGLQLIALAGLVVLRRRRQGY
jgi:hypothetical protein